MERIRTKNSISTVSATTTYQQETKAPTCTSALTWKDVSSWVDVRQIGSYESMSDVIVPGFYSKVREGKTFFNPMQKAKCTIDAGTGSTPEGVNKSILCSGLNAYYGKHRYLQGSLTVGRILSGFTFDIAANGMLRPPLSIIEDRVRNNARAEAVTSMLNNRGRASNNLFETAAELNKSLTLFQGLLGEALKTVSSKKKLLTRAKSAGSAYLAVRYGLLPLMYDIEAVKKGMLEETGKIRQTSRGYSSCDNFVTTYSANGHYAGLASHRIRLDTKESISYRAMSLDEYEATFFSNIGFTGKGLITLPWELLPYSFVADWFSNFGEFIGSLVPAFGYNQLGSCLVEDRYIEKNATVEYLGEQNPTIAVSLPHSGSCNQTWHVKTRSIGASQPSLIIRNNFGFERFTRVADAAALIAQKLR